VVKYRRRRSGEEEGGDFKALSDKYLDFGPTFAAEKLYEMDGIRLSKETLRKWLVEVGLWSKKSKKLRTGIGDQERKDLGKWHSSMGRITIG